MLEVSNTVDYDNLLRSDDDKNHESASNIEILSLIRKVHSPNTIERLGFHCIFQQKKTKQK